MSKIGCKCGHTITDQTDNIKYKAHFFRDQDYHMYDKEAADIASYISAVKTGNGDEWLNRYFGPDNRYKTGENDYAIIFSISTNNNLKYQSTMYLCEKCGRILIEKGKENKFFYYIPEDAPDSELFKGLL